MSAGDNRIGIEFISAFNMGPVEMVELAAELGCRHISLALAPMSTKHIDYLQWSLRDDKPLRRDVLQALQNHDVDISMGECYMIRPDVDFRTSARPDLDAMRELNIKRVNIVSIDPDWSRNIDQCGALVEMAAELGMETTLEFGPQLGAFTNLQSAVKGLEAVNKPNFKLVIDAMHFFRSGSTVADLATLDPSRVGYVQLCDVPVVSTYEQYMYEARYERLPPGQGELPLQEFLQAAPRDVVVGLELPMLAQAKAGVSARERLQGAVATTRELLAKVAE
jgi:sugar phosphate isomerase/epimerase